MTRAAQQAKQRLGVRIIREEEKTKSWRLPLITWKGTAQGGISIAVDEFSLESAPAAIACNSHANKWKLIKTYMNAMNSS